MEDRVIIDFRRLFSFLVRKIWLFVLVMAVFTGGGVWMARVSKNASVSYLISGKIIVTQKSGNESGEMLDNASRVQPLYDTKEILTSGSFLEGVKERLSFTTTVSGLKGSISVEHIPSTRILDITVSTARPEETVEILEAIQEYVEEYLEVVLPDVEVSSLDQADPAFIREEQNSADGGKTGILMGISACVILACILSVMYVFNSSIRYSEDVERYLGLPVAGELELKKDGRR